MLFRPSFRQIKNSEKLKRIMQTILAIGNALNQGTNRGEFGDGTYQLWIFSFILLSNMSLCR